MAERVTQTVRRTAVQPNSNARVTQVVRRAAVQPNSNIRVTQVVRRVAIADYTSLVHRLHAQIID